MLCHWGAYCCHISASYYYYSFRCPPPAPAMPRQKKNTHMSSRHWYLPRHLPSLLTPHIAAVAATPRHHAAIFLLPLVAFRAMMLIFARFQADTLLLLLLQPLAAEAMMMMPLLLLAFHASQRLRYADMPAYYAIIMPPLPRAADISSLRCCALMLILRHYATLRLLRRGCASFSSLFSSFDMIRARWCRPRLIDATATFTFMPSRRLPPAIIILHIMPFHCWHIEIAITLCTFYDIFREIWCHYYGTALPDCRFSLLHSSFTGLRLPLFLIFATWLLLPPWHYHLHHHFRFAAALQRRFSWQPSKPHDASSSTLLYASLHIRWQICRLLSLFHFDDIIMCQVKMPQDYCAITSPHISAPIIYGAMTYHYASTTFSLLQVHVFITSFH